MNECFPSRNHRVESNWNNENNLEQKIYTLFFDICVSPLPITKTLFNQKLNHIFYTCTYIHCVSHRIASVNRLIWIWYIQSKTVEALWYTYYGRYERNNETSIHPTAKFEIPQCWCQRSNSKSSVIRVYVAITRASTHTATPPHKHSNCIIQNV